MQKRDKFELDKYDQFAIALGSQLSIKIDKSDSELCKPGEESNRHPQEVLPDNGKTRKELCNA